MLSAHGTFHIRMHTHFLPALRPSLTPSTNSALSITLPTTSTRHPFVSVPRLWVRMRPSLQSELVVPLNNGYERCGLEHWGGAAVDVDIPRAFGSRTNLFKDLAVAQCSVESSTNPESQMGRGGMGDCRGFDRTIARKVVVGRGPDFKPGASVLNDGGCGVVVGNWAGITRTVRESRDAKS